MRAFKAFKNRQAVENNTANVPLQKLQTARRTGECTFCTLGAARRLRPIFTEYRVLNNRESSATTISLMRRALFAVTSSVIEFVCGLFLCQIWRSVVAVTSCSSWEFFFFFFAHSFCQPSKRSFPLVIRSAFKQPWLNREVLNVRWLC